MTEKSVDAGRYTEDYFLGSCGGSEFFKLYGPRVLKPTMAYSFARARIAPGMRVLDVGCGRGELLYHVRRAGAAGVGVDYAASAVKLAAEVSGCEVRLSDGKVLPFPSASFDRIFFVGVMDHLRDWELEECFSEFARVLKPDGFVVVHTCTNRLYYKNWTFDARRAAARVLRALGLPVRDPSPPRSDEDVGLHVNEHTLGSMRSFFRAVGWSAEVEPRPNYKLELREIYGDPLPPDLPLRPASRLKTRLYRSLLWRGPLKRFLAREFFCVARPPAASAPSAR